MKYGDFDLSLAFAGASLKDGRFAPLVRALRNLEASNAIRADLDEAKQAIDAGKSLKAQRGAVSGPEHIIAEALFVHALMLYCRAVHSSTRARHRIDVLGAFSPDQKKAHTDVTGLRDGVVAHYGTGETQLGGPWIQDHVVFRCNYFGFGVSYAHMRVASKAAVARSLLELIEVSLEYITEYATKKQNELLLLIGNALDEDNKFLEIVAKHPFSEEAFFGFAHPPGSSSRLAVPAGQKPSESTS